MKRLSIAILLLCVTALPAPAAELAAHQDETEGCQTLNPVQSTCTYTATHVSSSDVSGILGWGSWSVTIQIGKKKAVTKSPATGEPTAIGMTIPEGAKVTMKALTPGSGGTVGHVD